MECSIKKMSASLTYLARIWMVLMALSELTDKPDEFIFDMMIMINLMIIEW